MLPFISLLVLWPFHTTLPVPKCGSKVSCYHPTSVEVQVVTPAHVLAINSPDVKAVYCIVNGKTRKLVLEKDYKIEQSSFTMKPTFIVSLLIPRTPEEEFRVEYGEK